MRSDVSLFSKRTAAPRWTFAGAAPLFHTPPRIDTSVRQLYRSWSKLASVDVGVAKPTEFQMYVDRKQ